MKLMHLSDFHIGKKVNEFSMLEDQKYILDRIIDIVKEQQPQAVIIAGDVYDKSAPSEAAVELFDDFLVKLSALKKDVFVISGNHDSPERIAFGGRLMEGSGIHMSPVYSGKVTPITLKDEFGEINYYMLPFVKPSHVRRFFPEEKIESYTDAMRVAIDGMEIDGEVRNVLVSHQFVTGAKRTESEEISVGGADNVDATVFGRFDYVALGHIHSPQKCGSEFIRYSGTPLKYSFSEAKDQKTVTIIDMGEKGDVKLSFIPLKPKRDLVELKGTYNELVSKSFYDGTTYTEDYVRITLTDEEDIRDALAKLRVIYKNIMKLDYDNQRTRHSATIDAMEEVKAKTPLENFKEFYEMQNGQEMSREQCELIAKMIEEIWEEVK